MYTQKSDLDQFYTDEVIAQTCYKQFVQLFDETKFDLLIEPSAGDGSFLKLLPSNRRLGLDLDPKLDEIKRADFFEFEPPNECNNVAVVGNPPFGRVCSLAVRFFNKAAEFASVIAFIIPQTFKKVSLQNRLDPYFRLRFSVDLPKNSFRFKGEPYDVPCCFQVWERTKRKRSIKKPSLENGIFDFVEQSKADMAIRRVGGRAGKATDDVKHLSKSSHYFLRLKSSEISTEKLINIVNRINFSSVVNATAGVRSLSKPEFLRKIRAVKELKKIV